MDQYPDAWELAFGKRPAEQLYDLRKDPACINNIASAPAYAEIRNELRQKLEDELINQGDPRMFEYGDIFDSYPRHSSMRTFPGFRIRGAYNPAFVQEGQKLINKQQ
jgi:uncharacterized sulfatase